MSALPCAPYTRVRALVPALLLALAVAFSCATAAQASGNDDGRDGDWRASPLLREGLGRLPPALVLTAGYDPLRDEGLQYAQRLSEAGKRATHLRFERQIHGFILTGKAIDEANTAVTLCAASLRETFRPGT